MFRTAGMRLTLMAAVLLAANPLTAFSQELITQKALSADLALVIAQSAVQSCRANGYRISISIIDSSDILKAFVRDDGASIGTVELSHRKAFTALNYRRPSGEQLAVWKASPPPVNIPPEAAASIGGVPIKVGNDVIGAVGVSGASSGEKDEACAIAGIAKISDKLK